MYATQIVVTLGVLVTVACCLPVDLKHGKLPNKFTVTSLVVAVLAHVILGFYNPRGPLGGLGYSALGFLTGFGLLLILNLIGGAGAGDVKFMGALGAWLGWLYILALFVGTGVVALLYVLVQNTYLFLFGDISKKVAWAKLPYAAHASVAVVFVLIAQWLSNSVKF